MNTWQIEEVKQRSDLDAVALFLIEHADPVRLMLFPVFEGSRDACVKEIQDRIWREHTANPTSHWIFIRDPLESDGDGRKIVGACQWKFQTENPFPHGMPKFVAKWWPEGGGREFTNEFIGRVMMPRVTWMARPHVGISWMAVHNDYRRRSIGKALMAWGIQRTDELGLESFIDGTPLGTWLYNSCGYVTVAQVDCNMKPREDADKVRAKLENDFIPYGFTCTWRPVRGIWSDEEARRIWTERLAIDSMKPDRILIRESIYGRL